MNKDIQVCFLCGSTNTYFSTSKNKFTWYAYQKDKKICSFCYYKDYHKQVRVGTFVSYKEKIGLRKCSRCGSNNTQITLTRKGYPNRKWVQDGQGGHLCHKCTKKTIYKDRETEYGMTRFLAANPRYTWARMTLTNHKKKGCVIAISKKDLTELANQTDNCKFCGIKLSWGYLNGASIWTRPSLDRIDNTDIVLSYDKIQIICYRCNTIKGSRTMNQFYEYCNNIVKNFKP